MNLKIKYLYALSISFLLTVQSGFSQSAQTKGTLPQLKVSKNQHYFVTGDEKPFFWLGDTGWLTFGKLDRAGIDKYFKDRKEKGFNVVQVMVLHTLNVTNVYGDMALISEDVSKPLITSGNNFKNPQEYDYWDHVDYTLEVAQKNGIYVAMVPVWGTNVSKGNKVSKEQAIAYAKFLANRYKNRTNIIWLNGGDTHGNEFMDIWNAIGSTLKTNNPDQLVTFHPFGRTDSSENYHNAKWLDFNMFQSGHRRYDQDTLPNSFKEDNYKFVQRDLTLKPTKPTLDGEPSYEGIPHGLHDTLQPKWTDNDVRRYGYWSVFAGAAGYTYGHNAVMQMFRKGDKPAYGNKELWTSAINAPGARQMVHIKKLMLAFPYLERVPDQSLIANQGEKYDDLVATRANNYALIYTYTGRKIAVNMGKIRGDKITASWYNPRTGKQTKIGIIENKGVQEFQPSGDKKDGNDWVLILRSR
ncbi:glycoside hydrolase family 140 protein [Flavobacterium sp. FlaQc-48]|uniref:glycoside hydrolase family 140 protein n=1 Tax=Flavobacterium sp. FlaQc-48 TaxID=3374181 RepID=UPI003757169A